MAEYDVQINKYNANNLGYDQLYPQPMKHAETHLLGGSDPINIGGLGVSNPNLLINSYWASPDAIIDQRGGYVVPPGVAVSNDTGATIGTTDKYYTANRYNGNFRYISFNGVIGYVRESDCVRGYTGAGYGIDRWEVTGNIVVLIQSDGLQLINTGDTTAYFSQVLEPKDAGVYCGSLLVSSVSGAVTVFLRNHNDWGYQGSIDVTGPGVFSGALTITDARKSYNQWYEIRLAAGASIKLKAAKLELGTVQTLAHQENGNWVLNDPPPDKALELVKCQRYQVFPSYGEMDSGYAVVGVGIYKASNTLIVFVPLPAKLRTNPSIVTGDISKFRIRKSDGTVLDNAVTSISLDCVSSTGISISVAVSGTLTSGEAYILYTLESNLFGFDANL